VNALVYEKNVMGSGPFKFAEYQLGQSIKGVRNPDYYHQGLPYLDGFTGIYADKQAVRSTRSRSARYKRVRRRLPPPAFPRDGPCCGLGASWQRRGGYSSNPWGSAGG
jgi:hypothetical protein